MIETGSKTSIDKLKDSFPKNTCATIVAIFFVITIGFACIALPITEIVLGSLNINQCPIDSRIPIYLIVTGIAVFILLFSAIMQIIFDKARFLIIVNVILVLFLIGWLIIGVVWTYNAANRVQFYYPSKSTYCDYSTFQCARVMRFINFVFVISIMRSCTSGK